MQTLKPLKIVELLRNHGAVGVENAITTKTLKIAMHTDKTREVVHAVEKARDNGEIICACMTGNGGYYLPANAEEAKSYIKSQKSRLEHSLRRYHMALERIEELYGATQQGGALQERES